MDNLAEARKFFERAKSAPNAAEREAHYSASFKFFEKALREKEGRQA